jgi:hypothetical protein
MSGARDGSAAGVDDLIDTAIEIYGRARLPAFIDALAAKAEQAMARAGRSEEAREMVVASLVEELIENARRRTVLH